MIAPNFLRMKSWKDNLQLVREVNEFARRLFDAGWKADSVWQWLAYLEQEMAEFEEERRIVDIQAAYFYSMVNTIDFTTLEKMRDALKRLDTDLILPKRQTAPPAERTSPPGGSFWPQIAVACEGFHLETDATERLLTKTASFTQEKAKIFIERLAALSLLYDSFAMLFGLIAAALLYHTPPGTFVRFSAFREALQGAGAAKKPLEETWPPIMRYLGQGFLGRDAEVRDAAVYYLSANPIDGQTFENSIYRLVYRILLFLSWYDFANLAEENQETVVELHLWPALEIGIPVEIVLQEKLGAEPFLNYYVYYSGFFAEVIRQSNQTLFPEKKDGITVGQYIQSFVARYPEKKDLLVENQRSYVADEIRVHQWSEDKEEALFALVSLYVRLRECRLIDYRNWLTEEGVEKPLYEWKRLLEKDLSDVEREKIRQYLQVIHRPVKLKMEMITAFGEKQWREEPYLSRVLVLNELYTDVYPEPNGPLVVFSEESGGWELNKLMVDRWKDFDELTEEYTRIFADVQWKKGKKS